MKAWVYRPHSDSGLPLIRLEEAPVPCPGPQDLLLKVLKTSVCGSDEMLFRGDLADRVEDGVIPGHELCGEIVEMGSQVRGFRFGQKVTAESHYRFGEGGEEGVIGLWPAVSRDNRPSPFYHGSYSQYVCIPSSCAYLIPPYLDERQFWPSLFEPVGNDFLLSRIVWDRSPRRVGLFGCGPHGLYAQIFLHHLGVEQLIAFEPDAFRLDFARRLDCAHQIFDPREVETMEQVWELTEGEGFDVCVDMVGKTGQAFQQCVDFTRDGGTIALFGLFKGPFSVAGKNANRLIFQRSQTEITSGGKRLSVIGITGREGIWPALIATVAGSRDLQRLLMKLTTIIGPLDRLGQHSMNRPAHILKAAFDSFLD